jgi:septal ring-binding cell division protein DamX
MRKGAGAQILPFHDFDALRGQITQKETSVFCEEVKYIVYKKLNNLLEFYILVLGVYSRPRIH